MNEKQFDAFRERAIDELHAKQKLLSKYSRQGLMERWHFDQERATLQFFKNDGRLGVEADIIDIGSFSTRSSTWKWAWSNESVVPALRHRACALRELKDITGLALFTVEDVLKDVDGEIAWELAAFSIQHLNALACYRIPLNDDNTLFSFLALMTCRLAH
jgi:hypothetical protein